ncbi:hypothetical protein [Microbacterium sp. ZXX196]|uniref:hypothetical protein n=1 Tax=Microbacterium sp. ZXX196 TaxID=2609291 RepID=UPI001E29BD61|nr:hypothetical protein [Microbacterium sp. ZXX196]
MPTTACFEAVQARVSASILEALRARPAGGAALDGRLRAIIGAVLARGEADPAVTVDDVATATSMVALHVALQPDDARTAERVVDLAVRALAPGAGR